MSRSLSIVFAFVLILAAVLPAAAQAPQPLAALDDYIPAAMADWQVPGLAIAVVKDDQVIYSKGFGVRESGKPEPVDEQTLFAIGSSTKAFTAAAIGTLVDRGKMGWDDPLTTYLPEFRLSDPWITAHLTLRDALSHRSGLSRLDALWYEFDYSSPELIRRLRYHPIEGFRDRFRYQNLMYLAAGQALESVAGESWGDYVTQSLLVPLGMTSTVTSVGDLAGRADVATPHMPGAAAPRPISYRNIDCVAPAGALNSNAADMVKWLRFWLNGGKVGGTALLSEAGVGEMQTAQTIIRPDDVPFSLLYGFSDFTDYGLGWFLSDYAGHKLVDHSGNIDGMSAEVAFMPEERIGVVVLTNMQENLLPNALAFKTFDLLLGLPSKDWSALLHDAMNGLMQQIQAAAQTLEKSRVPDTAPSLPLESYAGAYENELYGRVAVQFADGKLTISQADRGRQYGELAHWDYDTFALAAPDLALALGGPALLTFTIGPDGAPSQFDFVGLGTFRRAP